MKLRNQTEAYVFSLESQLKRKRALAARWRKKVSYYDKKAAARRPGGA